MSKKTCGIYLTMLFLALSLGACGGGASNDDIRSQKTECADGIGVSCQLLGQEAPSTTISLLPASITVSSCTTNIPFIFYGGTPPFNIYSSNNGNVPVSSALPLGSKYYFLANVGSLGGGATMTVLDSQSRSATAAIAVGSVQDCLPRPLLLTEPASASARETEILAFKIIGGKEPFSVVVVSSAPNAVAVPVGEFTVQTFNVQAIKTGTDPVLLKVSSSDGQNSIIKFTVLPL